MKSNDCGSLTQFCVFPPISFCRIQTYYSHSQRRPEVLETASCTSKNQPHQPHHMHRMNKEFLARLNELHRRKQIKPIPTSKLQLSSTSHPRAKVEFVWSPGSPRDQQPDILPYLPALA